MNKWYEIKAKADRAEIWIYDYIGEDFWTGGGVTAKNFQKELFEIKVSQIDLHINSPGGDVFDGNAIYNLLKHHSATITTYIDGLAASIASVIALAGDKVYMAENALFMIHKPYMIALGNEDQIEQQLGVLKKVQGTIFDAYASKSGKSKEDVLATITIEKPENWMNADEALEAGFIDEITDRMDMAACAKFVPLMAKMGFKKIPEALNPNQPLSAKDIEKGLRDVGCSRKLAKTILAKGLPDDLRDVDHTEDSPPVTEPLRDVEAKKPNRKDRTNELLIAAERMAPTTI